MNLEDVKIYRMTHIDNVPHILLNGITNSASVNKNHNYITIEDVSLISTRSNKKVLVESGTSHDGITRYITLGEFIPFYFGVKMPMLYVVQNGGNFVDKPTNAEDVVYLVCSVSQIAKYFEEYYFSDGHATDMLSTLYDCERISDLPSIIDWDAVKKSYWGGQDNLNLKRKKQAEFLIRYDIGPNFVLGFGCYNDAARSKLLSFGISDNKIKIIPNAYY